MNVIDLSKFRLGKTRASAYDSKRLTLLNPQVERALAVVPTPPTRIAAARAGVTRSILWGMLGNDNAGDCTVAGAGHTILLDTTIEKHAYVPTTSQVLDTYFKLTGGPDSGLSLLDVLKPWQQTGLWGHKLLAYAELPIWPGVPLTRVRRSLRLSVWLAGSAYLAFSLPAGMQRNPLDWTTVGTGPEWRPGTWGGHCVPAVLYDGKDWWVVTWGRLVRVTEEFIRAYCDEGWMPVSEDWINRLGKTPNGRALSVIAEIGQQLAA